MDMQIDPTNLMVNPALSVHTQTNVIEINQSSGSKSLSNSVKTSHWTKLKVANRQILPRQSKGDTRLASIIDELKSFSIEAHDDIHESKPRIENNAWNFLRIFRRHLIHSLHKPVFHYTIISLVMADLLVVLVDLILGQLSSPCLTEDEMLQYNTTEQRDTCLLDYSPDLVRADLFLFYFSVLLLRVFVLEIFITFFAFGWKYYMNPLYFLDSTVVLASFIMEIYFHYGNIGRAGRAAAAIVILRLWKIIRAIHTVAHSITLRNRLLLKKIQEAKIVLEEEKQQTEEILEKQEIKLEYFMNILIAMDKRPPASQIDNYVSYTWNRRKKRNINTAQNQ